jgi:hypothetical protein
MITVKNEHLGTYLLRKTNDKTIQTKYTYLILNEGNNIKIKSVKQNGIFATKISKTGTIEFTPNFKNLVLKFIDLPLYYDIVVKINNVNKYSYSFFGIEFPEIRYKQISNYNIRKNMKARYRNYTFYVIDEDKNYYMFDLYPYLNVLRQPYIETPFNTLVATQVISFIINILLVKIFDII